MTLLIAHLRATPKALLAALLCALLSACSSLPKPQPSANSSATELLQLQQWQVQGKLGIRAPDNSGSLYFNWNQQPEQYSIYLSGPLGQGATWIKGSHNSRGKHNEISIKTGNQPERTASTPQALLHDTLGWSLPVEDLYYWIRGLPSPFSNATLVTRSDNGALDTLVQSGWQLQYQRFDEFAGLWLPKKLTAQHQNVRLTIVIKTWNSN